MPFRCVLAVAGDHDTWLSESVNDADQASRHTWPNDIRPRPPSAFTEPVWRDGVSVWILNRRSPRMGVMDVVAIVIGIALFAILLMLIEGIDRI